METHGTVAAFNDRFPVTEGHLLIVPLRHIADGFSMTEREIRGSEALTRILSEKIRTSDPTISGFNKGGKPMPIDLDAFKPAYEKWVEESLADYRAGNMKEIIKKYPLISSR